MNPPSIVVVTPTHGRVNLVVELLESLVPARVKYREAGGHSQVVIVDSSEPDDARRIEQACTEHDAIFIAGPTSVRKKRNIGVRAVDSELVVFTDSDCRVGEDFVTGHGLRALGAPNDIVGFAGITKFYGEETLAWRAAAASSFLDSFSFAAKYPQVEWAPFTNLSVRRVVFDEVGGFVEDWEFRLGADDVEFGRRITRGGRRIVSAPESMVWHSRTTWSRWRNVTERALRWGWMDVPLRQAQPREHLSAWVRGVPGALVVTLPVAALALVFRRPTAAVASLLTSAGASLAVDSIERRVRQPDAIMGAGLRALFEGAALVHAIRIGDPLLGISEIVPDTRAMQQDRTGRMIRTAAAIAGAFSGLATVGASVAATSTHRKPGTSSRISSTDESR